MPAWVPARLTRPRSLAVAIVATYLVAVAVKWWPTPDSALYLGLGRALALGRGYRFNGSVCTDVTPGWPVVLAGLRVVFGENYWVYNLTGALCALGTLGLVYKAISRMGGRPSALAVTACCAFSYGFLFNSQRILTDMPFALVFWATLTASLRARERLRWVPVAWLLAGAGLIVRAPGVIVLGALAVGLLLDNPRSSPVTLRRRVLVSGGIVLTVLALALGAYLLARWATHAEPFYALSVHRVAKLPWKPMVRRVASGLGAFPVLVAEMLTSQEGLWALSIPAIALMVVGAVTLWRSGQRLATVTVALGLVMLALVGGGVSLRVRYVLPLEPLMVYLAVAGLRWLAEAAASRWPASVGADLPRRSVLVMVLLVVGLNAPRLLRNAVYYSGLSHASRYYEVIQDGRFAEPFALADLIRRLCAADQQVGAPTRDVKILHYLTDRQVLGSRNKERTAADAEAFLKKISSLPQMSCVVVDTEDAPGDYWGRLLKGLADPADWKQVYQGRRYRMFLRTPATDSPATRNAEGP